MLAEGLVLEKPALRAKLSARDGVALETGLTRRLLQLRREEVAVGHAPAAPFRQSEERDDDAGGTYGDSEESMA